MTGSRAFSSAREGPACRAEYMRILSVVSMLFVFLLTAPGYPGGKSMGQDTAERKPLLDFMKSLLDPEWEKLKPNPVPESNEPPKKWWMYYISPPFPSVWPPNPNLALVYYVYAQGHDFTGGLRDAVYIGAPWAYVVVDTRREVPPKFKLLSNKIKEAGIQGISLLSEEGAAIYKQGGSAEAFLGNLTTLPDENEKPVSGLRKYYCTWLKLNGAIASEIRSFHKEFFKWLRCE